MENSIALIKPKLTAAEKKIIAMVIDGLPSENSRFFRLARIRKSTGIK